nr:hypothetical protein [Nocardia terpenica]
MIDRELYVPLSWTGDRDREAYDQARYLRDWLEERDAFYVMAC